MKQFAVVFLFLSALSALHAQSTYFHPVSPPLGHNISVTQILSPAEYSVWDYWTQGPITYTTNNGTSWNYMPLPKVKNEYVSYYMYKRNGLYNALVVAYDSSLYHTSNAGIHWTRVTKQQGYILSLSREADGNLYAVCQQYSTPGPSYSYYVITSADGISWSRMGNIYNVTDPTFLKFVKADGLMYILYSELGVMRAALSTNGGSTWRQRSWFASTVSRSFVEAFAEGTGLYVHIYKRDTGNGYVVASYDTGANFGPADGFLADTTFSEYSHYDPYTKQGTFVKKNRHIIARDFVNGVYTDVEYSFPLFYNLYPRRSGTTVLGFYDENFNPSVLYRYDFAQGLYTFLNGNVHRGYNFNKIMTVNANTVYAFGDKGRIAFGGTAGDISGIYFYPADNKWVDASYPGQTRMFVLAEGGGFLAGDQYPGFSTFDFTLKKIFSSDKFAALHFYDDFNGFVFSENGNMYSTSNAGDTWSKKASGIPNVRRMYFLPRSDTGFAVGTSGIYRSTNRGQTWNSVFSGSSIFSVTFLPDRSLGIAHGATQVYKSLDKGATWTLIGPIGYEFDDGNIAAFSADEYVLASAYRSPSSGAWSSTLCRTTNAGATWSFSLLHAGKVTAMGGLNKDCFFLAGDEGTIYRTMAFSNSVLVGSASGFRQDTISIPVSVDFIRDKRYSSFDLRFQTDGTKLSYVGIDTSYYTIAHGWNLQINPQANGSLTVGGYTADLDSMYNGNLFRLLYKITAPAAGVQFPFNVTLAQFNTGSEPVSLYNGAIKVDSVMYGDVDVNNMVQVYDGSYTLKTAATSVFPSYRGWRQADVTNDGTVSALDASYIVKYVVGLIPSLPVGGPIAPAQGRPVLASRRTPEGKIVVPFSIADGQDILSMQGTIRYDKAKLRYTGVNWSPGASQFMKEIKTEDGSISFAAASTQETALSGEVCYLTFERQNQWAEEPAEVKLENFRLNENKVAPVAFILSVDAPTSVENADVLPKDFALEQNFPNPFNPSTVIRYALPEESAVRIAVYNSLGESVRELVNAAQPAGFYQQDFSAANLPGGVYFYTISATGAQSGKQFQTTKKMLLLK